MCNLAGDPLYGNLQNGVVTQNGATNNTIGGVTAEGNLISGNSGNGILIIGEETGYNLISDNIIGGDINKDCTADPTSGDCSMGNGGYGIVVKDKANNNLIGSLYDNDKANTIAYNGYTLDLKGHGVVIESGVGNIIRYNSIYDNHDRGIDLVTPAGQANAGYAFTINDHLDADSGLNNLQNYADPMHKDIFVEIDAMTGLAPSQQVLDMVSNGRNATEGFANAPAALVNNPDGSAGINLHFMTDSADLQVPKAEWDQPFVNGWPPEFNPIKSQYFGNPGDRDPSNPKSAQILSAKRLVFRYGSVCQQYWSQQN